MKRVQRKTILGTELVTIPLSDYRDLLAAKRALAEAVIDHRQFDKPARSTIDRNPEVAVFLVQRFGRLPMKEILRLCRRRFGKADTPSRTAAYRYWEKVRVETRSSRGSAAI